MVLPHGSLPPWPLKPWRDSYRLRQRPTSEARQRLDVQERDYETTIFRDEDRARFGAYKEVRANYGQAARILSDPTAWPGTVAAEAALRGPLQTRWIEGRNAVQAVVDDSDSTARKAAASIVGSVDLAKTSIEVSLLVATLAATICGYLLLRAVTVPMKSIISLLQDLRGGDLRQRLALRPNDEFLAVEEGFNQMSGELTSLVGQAQRSAIQVTTSVNEIAATARQQ